MSARKKTDGPQVITFTFSRPDLAGALKRCADVTEKKGDKPWYAGALIEVDHASARVLARDAYSGIAVALKSDLCKGPRPLRVLADARDLLNKISTFQGDEISIEIGATSATLRQLIGKRFCGISLMTASDFKPMDTITDGRSFSVTANLLGAMIQRVIHAVNPVVDAGREICHCVLLSYESGVLTASAFDGKRAARVRANVNLETSEFKIYVPHKAAKTIADILYGAAGEAHFTWTERSFSMRFQGVETSHTFFDMSAFGSYDALFIPSNTSCVVDRNELLSAVVASNAVRPSYLTVAVRGKTMMLDGRGVDSPEPFHDEIDAEDGSDASARLVPANIADALKNMSTPKIRISFSSEDSLPVVVAPYFGEKPSPEEITDDSAFAFAKVTTAQDESPAAPEKAA